MAKKESTPEKVTSKKVETPVYHQVGLLLPEARRDEIVKWLDGTNLPHGDVRTVMSLLMDLKRLPINK